MRIVQVCPYSWDVPGGVHEHVRSLADQLRANGHEVLVVAPGDGASPDPGVRIVGRPFAVPFNGSRAPICFGTFEALAVRDSIDAFVPDVLHLHEPLSPSVGLLALIFARVPVVATFHASFDDSLDARLYTWEARLMRGLMKRVKVGIAVSESAARCIRDRAPVPIRLIPNGVDVQRFAAVRRVNGRRMLLFVNRLEERKGFAVAVRAFGELAPRFDDVDLAVLGDGPERVAVETLAPDVRARVTMLGHLGMDEVPAQYGRADVFLAPATGRESFGVVLLEAMAAGVPIVASAIEGYSAVVRHEVEGLLTPPSDSTAVASAVARILEDPSLAQRLGEAGRRRAQQYAWATVTRDIEQAYDEAVAAGRYGRAS